MSTVPPVELVYSARGSGRTQKAIDWLMMSLIRGEDAYLVVADKSRVMITRARIEKILESEKLIELPPFYGILDRVTTLIRLERQEKQLEHKGLLHVGFDDIEDCLAFHFGAFIPFMTIWDGHYEREDRALEVKDELA